MAHISRSWRAAIGYSSFILLLFTHSGSLAQCDQGFDFIDFPVDKMDDELVWLSERLPALVVFFGEEGATRIQHRALSESLLNDSSFIGDAAYNIIYVLDGPLEDWSDSTHFLPFVNGPRVPPNVYVVNADRIAFWTADMDPVLVDDSACDSALYLYFEEEAADSCATLGGVENLSSLGTTGCNALVDILTGEPMVYGQGDGEEANVPRAGLMYVCSQDSLIRNFGLMAWPENATGYLESIIDHPDLEASSYQEAAALLIDHLRLEVDDLLLSFDPITCGSIDVYPHLIMTPPSPTIDCGAPLPAPESVQFILYDDIESSTYSIGIDSLFDVCVAGMRKIRYSFLPDVLYAVWIPAHIRADYGYDVNVLDDIPPVWSSPGVIPVVECDSIRQKIDGAIAPSVADGCLPSDQVTIEVDTVEAHFDGPSPFFTKTWIATDLCGNSNSLSQIFFVEDSEIDIMACPEDVTGLLSLDSIHPTLDGSSFPEVEVFNSVMFSYEDFPIAEGLKRMWMVENGCGATATCEQLFLLAVRETVADIRIFPSPATETFHIQFDEDRAAPVALILYNSMGSPVHALMDIGDAVELSLNISSLAAGRYLLSIIHADGDRSTHGVVKY